MKTLLGTIDGYLARVSTKTYVGIVFGTVLAVGLSAMAIPPEQGKLQPLPAQVVAALTRPCILQPGAWTNIACTGTGVAATSALLNQWSQYLFYCPQNSAIRTGTTTTQATPTTADGVFPAGGIVRIPTTDTILYIGCLPTATQTGCQILECK